MIVYLYGPDSYRRGRRAQFYKESFKKKYSTALAVERFDLNEADEFERLSNFVSDQSLFGGGMKFGEVHNAGAVEAKKLKPVLEAVFHDKTTTLIITEEKKLERSLDAFLKKSFKPEAFDILSGREFRVFLRKEIQKRNLSLGADEEALLLRTYEGDSWGLVNQLEKMALGGKAEALLRNPEMFPLMFRLTGPAPFPKKLSALAWLLEREEPAKVFNIIAAQKNQALKKKMADYDVLVKSGKLGYEEVLFDLALQ